ncbi:hypothetical protein AMJ48_03000 [Parcubacteria bacterium DG_74_1]|nr:MAG: hypothetical protein AMJ48_03000 [Parcubacteria bacterium DG_74_1]
MKLKYSKEEKREEKEKPGKAEEIARDLVRLNFSIDTEMAARIEAGISLGVEMSGLNIPRQTHLGPHFQDWKLIFYLNEEKREYSLGRFILHCHTEELSYHVELRDLTSDLVKAILKREEIGKFSDAVKDGMRKILRDFNSHFNNRMKSLPWEKQEVAQAIVTREIKIARLTQATTSSLTVASRIRWLVPLPLEITFGKASVNKIRDKLEMALGAPNSETG